MPHLGMEFLCNPFTLTLIPVRRADHSVWWNHRQRLWPGPFAPGWYTVQWCVHTFFLIVLPSNVLEYHTYLTVVNGFSFTLLYKGIFTKWILQVDKNAGWHFFVWHPVSSAVCKWVISEEEPLKYVRIHHPNICEDDDDVMEMGEK